MTAVLNQLLPKAAELIRWLIVMGIAYTLATGVLYFLADPSVTQAGASVPETPNSGALRRPFNVNEVANKHLFGEAVAVDESAVASQDVEITRLPLELHGVFVAEVPEDSAAIVAQKNKAGTLYAIGDEVPGNATLIDVYATHIILRRAGVNEKLEFETLSSGFIADPYNDEDAGPAAGNYRDADASEGGYDEQGDGSGGDSVAERQPRTPREFLEAYRERLTEDPEGLLSELGVTAVADGDGSGYQLGNLANSPYLSQTGLKSGDVILSVNGQPVGNVQQDQLQMNSLLAQGSARLEVQRGSRRFYVTASLK